MSGRVRILRRSLGLNPWIFTRGIVVSPAAALADGVWPLIRLFVTADFMDEKHIVVVGGTWALHPRISGKRTL